MSYKNYRDLAEYSVIRQQYLKAVFNYTMALRNCSKGTLRYKKTKVALDEALECLIQKDDTDFDRELFQFKTYLNETV